MPSRKPPRPPPIEPRAFASVEEIDRAIKKLQRRIEELSGLDVQRAVLEESGEDDAIRSNIREAIREVFGENSPEFREHQHLQIWAGPMGINMSPERIIDAREKGKVAVRTTLENLITRLREKREELDDGSAPAPESYFAKLNLHPRIADVANDLYLDGHHWDAVFAAAKALVNYVKERSGADLDGANLMRTVFSRQKPILAFNDLADQTKQDEQEGMMHLFEGAVLAIRNPGGHAFPEVLCTPIRRGTLGRVG